MLGKRLKTYRMNKKISQKKIGELVDRDIQTIRSWEDGKSEPKASELVKLSDFYGVSLDEMCRGEETVLDKKNSNTNRRNTKTQRGRKKNVWT